MREGLTIVGFLLLIFGIIFTVMSGGYGIVLGGPIALIGFILLIMGAFSSEHQTIIYQKEQSEIKQKSKRYCPSCGRAIPFDANICPYCGKKF